MGKRALGRFLHEVDEAVFPSSIYCVSCGALIDRSRMYSLCDECMGKMHWITGRTCGKCGKAMPDTSKGRLCYDCMQEEHFFRRGFSALTYGLHERELMMDLKYGGRGYLARIFGDILFDRLEWEICQGMFAPADPADPKDDPGFHVRIDLIAPVPVSKGRLRKRGYNQSAIMAQQLAGRWRKYIKEAKDTGTSRALCPAPYCRSQVLYRTRETRMLRSMNPTERRMALLNAFEVTDRERDRIAGKNVLLVDDIYTTGATADSCAQALLRNGASEVCLLTLASGGNRRPGELNDLR